MCHSSVLRFWVGKAKAEEWRRSYAHGAPFDRNKKGRARNQSGTAFSDGYSVSRKFKLRA
jgi:hypothetical protein